MTDIKNFPQHVAIIMDGNGRWAQERGLPRIDGHREGINSVDAMVTAAITYQLSTLILFAFSSENWQRPKTEIAALMQYLSQYLDRELPRLSRDNIRFNVIGRISDLSPEIVAKISRNTAASKNNTGLHFVVALSYGGRNEIIDAAKKIAVAAVQGEITPAQITADTFRDYLYLPLLADPDLLIRTSGEMRVSNFLLWQIAYTELYVTKTLWPDFRQAEFQAALEEYAHRQRRFGR